MDHSPTILPHRLQARGEAFRIRDCRDSAGGVGRCGKNGAGMHDAPGFKMS